MTKALQNIDQSVLDEIAEGTRLYQMLYNNWDPKPKKMKKFLTKLYLGTEFSIQLREGIIAQALLSPDCSKFILNKLHMETDMSEAINKLVADGNHGMIVVKDVVYPCKLEVNPIVKWLEDGKQWDYEQEMLIQHDLAQNWMKEQGANKFIGSVVLFREFGFTGLRREIEMRIVESKEGLERYPGTNYYVKPKG